MRKTLSTCYLIVFFWMTVSAQPSETFLGSIGPDLIARMIPASDGTIWATGSKTIGDHRQVWLIHLSESGSVLMDTTILPPTADRDGYGHQLAFLSDGTILICGEERKGSGSSSGTGMAMNVDTAGTVIWKNIYLGTAAIYDAVPSGNDILLGGAKNPFNGILMMVDELGGSLWTQDVSVYDHANVHHIFPTGDGNFVLAGRCEVIDSRGVFLMKVKPDGAPIWHNGVITDWDAIHINSNANFYNQPLGAVQATDETFWMTIGIGIDPEVGLLQFSPSGDLLQMKKYRDPTQFRVPYDLVSTFDGDWLIFGQTLNFGGLSQGFAMCIDSKGLELWNREYGSENASDRLFAGLELSDKQWLMAGLSNHPNGKGNDDGWLLHTEADGNILPWTVGGRIVLDLNANCALDVGEPYVKDWFVEVHDTSSRLTISDSLGYFEFRTDTGSATLSVVAPEPSDIWQICNNNQVVVSDAGNPASFVTFLVQPTDGGCPHTEVSLTQPDLVRCDTSTFVVSLVNRGAGASEPLILQLIPDPELTILSASEPFFVTGDGIEFDIEPMDIFQQRSLEFRARLSCDVQLGATHGIIAGIQPKACVEAWEGARFGVQGVCTGGQVDFTLTNDGGGGAGAQTLYRVLADDLLFADWTVISLPEGEPPVSLSFPADGRTWRVDVQQAPDFPGISRPTAAVEACGTGKNGLHSIALRNAWPADDGNPETAWVLAPNTTGVPDKVAEVMRGFGYFNLVDEPGWEEYSARIQNHLSTMVERVEFRISFSTTLDIRTFQVVASKKVPHLTSNDQNQVGVVMEHMNLAPGESAMLRFRIRPYPDTPPNAGRLSLFITEADAYFDGYGPYPLYSGFYNYADNFPVETDKYNSYSPNILRFGGRANDVANRMASAADGSVFLVGETDSYSDRTNRDGLVIKTDANGKAIWLNALDFGDQGLNTINGVVPLDDGGCLVSGNYRPAIASDYLFSLYAYVARLKANGQMSWYKKLRPWGSSFGAWTEGMLPTLDDNALMFGYSENANGGRDPFYLKLNSNGETIWKEPTASGTSSFIPEVAVQMSDGGFAFAGSKNALNLHIERIDADGHMLWNKGYMPSKGMYLWGMARTPNDGLIVTGTSNWEINPGEVGITPIFLRVTSEGNFLWEKYPVVGPFQIADSYDLIPAPGGGYYSVGGILVDTDEYREDVMLLKIDENGDTLWCRHYGAQNFEIARSILITEKNGILMWGHNQLTPPLYDGQTLLVHTDLNGDVMVGTQTTPVTPGNTVVTFPNPARDILHVLINGYNFTKEVHWQLRDINGRTILHGSTSSPQMIISIGHLSTGMYVLVFPENAFEPKRIIVW
ncbi:MAG: T9SS type A sorting domain-containing protein [Saprospiraceae bacterium]|nr:T9SS type A sorting domain-containing protein [Saprospiraceae bacterium]